MEQENKDLQEMEQPKEQEQVQESINLREFLNDTSGDYIIANAVKLGPKQYSGAVMISAKWGIETRDVLISDYDSIKTLHHVLSEFINWVDTHEAEDENGVGEI